MSSSDANNTYTERSIDDAVQERKARSGSIKSKPQGMVPTPYIHC